MFRGTSKECPRSSNWRWFKEKDKIRTLGNEKQFFASGFVMKEKTRLLRKEGLGEWAKGCGVSVTLALVSTHCKLLRSTSSQSLTAGAPAWIGNVYGTNPHQWHLIFWSSQHPIIWSSQHLRLWSGWRARARPCPGKEAQQRAGPALPAWPLFSLWKNTENEIPLLCERLSNLMTKGSIQSWKLLLFFSGGIQSRTGWRFSSKWG